VTAPFHVERSIVKVAGKNLLDPYHRAAVAPCDPRQVVDIRSQLCSILRQPRMRQKEIDLHIDKNCGNCQSRLQTNSGA